MSEGCKLRELPLTSLKPKWVEPHQTGVLRCLKPQEHPAKAAGLVFECPRCMHSKKKAHLLIFLFNNGLMAPEARPPGRFQPSLTSVPSPVNAEQTELVPEGFWSLSLSQEIFDIHGKRMETHLKPGDMKCEWEGTLQEGIVRWRPNWWERMKGR